MTTIVITQEVIAWDSQVTTGDERGISATEKVRLVRPGVILAFAGDLADHASLEAWLHEYGHDHRSFPRARRHASFEAAVITKDGFFTYDERCDGHGVKVNTPICLGSGGAYARSLLAANAELRLRRKITVLEAVRVAGTLDVNTGPPYKVLNIAKELARKRVKT